MVLRASGCLSFWGIRRGSYAGIAACSVPCRRPLGLCNQVAPSNHCEVGFFPYLCPRERNKTKEDEIPVQGHIADCALPAGAGRVGLSAPPSRRCPLHEARHGGIVAGACPAALHRRVHHALQPDRARDHAFCLAEVAFLPGSVPCRTPLRFPPAALRSCVRMRVPASGELSVAAGWWGRPEGATLRFLFLLAKRQTLFKSLKFNFL